MDTDSDASCRSVSRSDDSDQGVEHHDHEQRSDFDNEPTDADTSRMVEIPGGEFRMGTDSDVGFPADGKDLPEM